MEKQEFEAIYEGGVFKPVGAESAMLELSRYPCEFFTSNGVLLECGNASAKKPYRGEVKILKPARRLSFPNGSGNGSLSDGFYRSHFDLFRLL